MKSLIYTNLIALVFLLWGCSSGQRHQTNVEGEGHHHHYSECQDGECETKMKSCDMKSCKMNGCQMYEKHCAYSVSLGDMHVKGKDEYKLNHKGHAYYFSSAEKMKAFQKKLDENVRKADKNWDAFKWQQLR